MSIDAPKTLFKNGEDVPSKFVKAASSKRNEIAISLDDRTITWGELLDKTMRVANKLRELGIGRGSRVGVLSYNSIEYTMAYWGALVAGACAVPLPTMASTESLKAMLLDSAPAVLFMSSKFTDLAAPFIAEVKSIIPNGKVGLDFEKDGWVGIDKWSAGASANVPDISLGPDDEFHIIYSSGTTGVPKGIRHSHGNRVAFVNTFLPIYAAPGAKNIISTPYYSHTTMVTWLPSMAAAVPNVVMDKFDEHEFLELCRKEKPTIAMLVPAQYERILRVKDFDSYDLKSFAVKFSTSSLLRAETKKKIVEKWPGMLIEFYGLTEGGVATILVATQYPDKLDSVGVPSPGCEIKIIDDSGRELPRGETGEIVGRNAIIMSGYHNRDEATNEMIWRDAQGRVFIRSGDLGRMDKDGFIYISGRKRDMIISGGFNIFAIDLEIELMRSPDVLEAAVIGIPSERWGETPLGFVVMEEGTKETPQSILESTNARLGKNQRLSAVEFRKELPKNQIGKALKKELRKPYWGDK